MIEHLLMRLLLLPVVVCYIIAQAEHALAHAVDDSQTAHSRHNHDEAHFIQAEHVLLATLVPADQASDNSPKQRLQCNKQNTCTLFSQCAAMLHTFI